MFRVERREVVVRNDTAIKVGSSRPGVVAYSCNPATRRPGSVDGLRPGHLPGAGLCRPGVRAKPGINMVGRGEPRPSRLPKERRTGPGRKRSRQKSPCLAVAGSRP